MSCVCVCNVFIFICVAKMCAHSIAHLLSLRESKQVNVGFSLLCCASSSSSSTESHKLNDNNNNSNGAPMTLNVNFSGTRPAAAAAAVVTTQSKLIVGRYANVEWTARAR